MNKNSELQFIPRLGLQNLKRVQSGYVCTCPKCGINSPWKTKLYILTEHKSFVTVFCQKCGMNTNLRNFIRENRPLLFEEYKAEEKKELYSDIKNGNIFKKQVQKSEINTHIELQYKFKLNTKYFKSATAYRESVEFCKKRYITEHIDSFFYNIHPKNVLSGMIIFPFYLEDQETLYGFQGRHCKEKLFNTHSKNESMKVYNMYNVELNKPVHIFESIIDSLMVDNSIAMLGTSLSKPVLDMMKDKIFITDNDKVGKNKALQYLNEGHKCFIYPDNFKYKDFNEAVCAGMPKSELSWLIKDNVFDKTRGITKLKLQILKMKN